MDHFAGLDVSVKETSICIVDDAGKIVREVKVASEPEALLAVLKNPEIRSHIARCLRDYPNGGEGVITLAGVEHCFMYVVQNDVVDTVIGPPDYIEQVFNEGRQDMQEGQSPLPRKDHD
jgi:hypothetical protein